MTASKDTVIRGLHTGLSRDEQVLFEEYRLQAGELLSRGNVV